MWSVRVSSQDYHLMFLSAAEFVVMYQSHSLIYTECTEIEWRVFPIRSLHSKSQLASGLSHVLEDYRYHAIFIYPIPIPSSALVKSSYGCPWQRDWPGTDQRLPSGHSPLESLSEWANDSMNQLIEDIQVDTIILGLNTIYSDSSSCSSSWTALSMNYNARSAYMFVYWPSMSSAIESE